MELIAAITPHERRMMERLFPVVYGERYWFDADNGDNHPESRGEQ